MEIVVNFWEQVSGSGTQALSSPSEIKRIKLTNRFGIIACIFTFPYLIGFIWAGLASLGILLTVCTCVYAIVPILTSYRLYNTAKAALYLTVLVHQFVVASAFGQQADIHLMYIALSLLPLVLYDYRVHYGWLTFYLACTVVALVVLYLTSFSLFHIDVSPEVIRSISLAYNITTIAGVFVILASSQYLASRTEEQLDSDNWLLQLQLESIFENSHDALFLVDADERVITRANKRALELFEMDAQEMIGKHGLDLQAVPLKTQELEEIRKALNEGERYEAEVAYRKSSGASFWGSLAIRQILIGEKKFQVVRITDVSEQYYIRERLKASLQEKELLLAEIHHRVKNNLAVISGLLSLQSSYIADENAKEMFMESRNRIHTMALIHDKLYRHETFGKIDFEAYLKSLVKSIRASYNNSSTILKFTITCNDILLDIKYAVPCGLIVNELISNACKHAFRDREHGEIRVVCTKMGEKFTMMVADDGYGFDLEGALQEPNSLGLTLIAALSEQVNGTFRSTSHQGTAFYISFEV